MPQEFSAMQQQAIERLKEMQRRAAPAEADDPPPKAGQPAGSRKPGPGGLFGSLFSMNGDLALVLPLLLLLGREGADDALLLALLYIMM